jgi:hypothetical protein
MISPLNGVRRRYPLALDPTATPSENSAFSRRLANAGTPSKIALVPEENGPFWASAEVAF